MTITAHVCEFDATVLRRLPEYVRFCSNGLAEASFTVVGDACINIVRPATCDPDAWAVAIVRGSYSTIDLIILPRDIQCPWAGMAMQGCAYRKKGPCIAWISQVTLDTVLHEIGHTMGLFHAGRGGDGPLNDGSSAMSALDGLRCFNSPQAWSLGWAWWTDDLGYKDVARIPIDLVVPASWTGPVNFARLRSSLTGLRYPVFVSYRRRFAYDEGLLDKYADKVLIHSYAGGYARDYDTTTTALVAVLERVGDAWAMPNATIVLMHIDVVGVNLRVETLG